MVHSTTVHICSDTIFMLQIAALHCVHSTLQVIKASNFEWLKWANYRKTADCTLHRANIPSEIKCIHVLSRCLVERNKGISQGLLRTQRKSISSFTYSTHCLRLPQCPYYKWIRWCASFHLIMCFSVESREWIIQLNANEEGKSWLVPDLFHPARLFVWFCLLE